MTEAERQEPPVAVQIPGEHHLSTIRRIADLRQVSPALKKSAAVVRPPDGAQFRLAICRRRSPSLPLRGIPGASKFGGCSHWQVPQFPESAFLSACEPDRILRKPGVNLNPPGIRLPEESRRITIGFRRVPGFGVRKQIAIAAQAPMSILQAGQFSNSMHEHGSSQ